MTAFDSDHLRTFLAIAEAGSITAGAERIGRSQPAVSLQVRQIEQAVGRALFRRHGRGVALTQAGEALLPVARRVTRTLDSALADIRGENLRGRLRIGLPEDRGHAALTRIVAAFTVLHPDVELDVQCAIGAGFADAMTTGRLDLAVFETAQPTAGMEVLRRGHLVWLGRRDREFEAFQVLPVAVFDRACWWRDVALAGLEQVGRAHRVVLSSESASGVRAAVHSGIAAGLMSENEIGSDIGPVAGLAIRQPSHLVMQMAPGKASGACAAMAAAIRREYAQNAARGRN